MPCSPRDCSVCLSFWVSLVEALGPVCVDQGLPWEGTVYPLRPDSPQLWLRLLLQNDGDTTCLSPPRRPPRTGLRLCLPRPGTPRGMSWVFPSRKFLGGKRCIWPLTLGGLQETETVPPPSVWGFPGTGAVTVLRPGFPWVRLCLLPQTGALRLGLCGPCLCPPPCPGQEFSARQVIEFPHINKSIMES